MKRDKGFPWDVLQRYWNGSSGPLSYVNHRKIMFANISVSSNHSNHDSLVSPDVSMHSHAFLLLGNRKGTRIGNSRDSENRKTYGITMK